MAWDIIVRKDGTVTHRTNIYLDLDLKRQAKKAGINYTQFMNEALRVYFEYSSTMSPEEALVQVAERIHFAHKDDATEEQRIAQLVAEHEAREQERERRRRLDVTTRLEAVIRQAEAELALLRGEA